MVDYGKHHSTISVFYKKKNLKIFDADVTANSFCDLDSMTTDLLRHMFSICFISSGIEKKTGCKSRELKYLRKILKNNYFLQSTHGNLITFWINW